MAQRILVTNKDNHFQRIEVLKNNRKKRSKYQEFYVEGVKVVDSVIAHNWEITGLYYVDVKQEKKSDWAKAIIEKCTCDHFILAPSLLEELSEKEETSELLLTVKMPPDNLGRLNVHEKMLCVIFDRPASPGNLGSSIRSCDAFGVDGIIVTGHAADIYDPYAVRGSMGTLFSQNVVRVPAFNDISAWINELRATYSNLQVLGTSAKGTESLPSFKAFDRPIVLMVGNETYGLSNNFKSICDTLVSIPMHGWASSLNVSCALSVALYQISSTRT